MSIKFDISLLKAIVIVPTLVGCVILILYASQYRNINLNEYVIHLRRGRFQREGTGGHVVPIPLIDKVIVVPTGKTGSVVQQITYEEGTIQIETGPPLDYILLPARSNHPLEQYMEGDQVTIIEFVNDVCVVESESFN